MKHICWEKIEKLLKNRVVRDVFDQRTVLVNNTFNTKGWKIIKKKSDGKD